MSKDYEIGYKKPPKKNQFKPGQSGNPSGKKSKKASPKNIPEALVAELAKCVPLTVDGKIVQTPIFYVLVKQWINQSIKGTVKDKAHLIDFLSKKGLLNFIQDVADDISDEPIYTEEDRRLLEITSRELGYRNST